MTKNSTHTPTHAVSGGIMTYTKTRNRRIRPATHHMQDKFDNALVFAQLLAQNGHYFRARKLLEIDHNLPRASADAFVNVHRRFVSSYYGDNV